MVMIFHAGLVFLGADAGAFSPVVTRATVAATEIKNAIHHHIIVAGR